MNSDLLFEFLEKSYQSKKLSDFLLFFPDSFLAMLASEKLFFFSFNDVTGEIEEKVSLGYEKGELRLIKKMFSINSFIGEDKNILFSALKYHDSFINYFLLVERAKNFNEEEKKDFQVLVAQLSLLLKHFSLVEKYKSTYLDTIQALVRTIDAKCEDTKGHSERVTYYAVALGQEMGLSEEQLENLREAAYLHDLGKIGIADSILKKAAGLTEEEMEEMKKHPYYTALILNGVAGLQNILPLAEYHHECYDGSGYPAGLKGEQIPLGARIIAVADAFDAMTADRVYRKAMSMEEAVDIIIKGSGTQFDPLVVTNFINLLDKKKSFCLIEKG